MTQTLSHSHGASITATPKPVGNSSKSGSKPQSAQLKADLYSTNPSGIVVGLTLSMSWQLAIVFLVPLVAGHVLDDKLNTSPWLTVAGLGIAMLAMVVVVRRTLAQLNEYTSSHEPTAEKKGDK